MTKINQTNEAIELPETFSTEKESYVFLTKPAKTKSRRWKYTQPDLTKICFICDNTLKVKYILPRKAYSQKNLWGHWTQKSTDQNKYICNSCLLKLHSGSMSDWITNKNKADNFYNYIYRGSFDK